MNVAVQSRPEIAVMKPAVPAPPRVHPAVHEEEVDSTELDHERKRKHEPSQLNWGGKCWDRSHLAAFEEKWESRGDKLPVVSRARRNPANVLCSVRCNSPNQYGKCPEYGPSTLEANPQNQGPKSRKFRAARGTCYSHHVHMGSAGFHDA